jgi:tellurium resistance protein TerD
MDDGCGCTSFFVFIGIALAVVGIIYVIVQMIDKSGPPKLEITLPPPQKPQKWPYQEKLEEVKAQQKWSDQEKLDAIMVKYQEEQQKEDTRFKTGLQAERKAEEEAVKCPICKSTQITANKKGYGLGKAAIGGVLLGPVGLLGGFVGSGKVKVTCLKCGYSWKPGSWPS